MSTPVADPGVHTTAARGGGAGRTEALRGIEREVGVLIRRVKRVVGDRSRAVHPDLQPASYLMLIWLVDHGPARAAAMVEAFAIDKGAVSRQLQHLDDLGLVDRTPDPEDRRASLVQASAEGRRRLTQVADDRRVWLDERLADWGDDELDHLVDQLGRYNAALEGPVRG